MPVFRYILILALTLVPVVSQAMRVNVDSTDNYRYGHLIISGDQDDTLSLPSNMTGITFNNIANDYIDRKKNEGYYYVSLIYDRSEKIGRTINLFYNMQLGPQVTISLIEYNGLTRTNPDLIARYIKIKENDILNPSMIEQGLANIEKSDLVAIDRPPDIVPDQGLNSAKVLYHFRETKQFHIEGAGGYVPDDGGYFVWYLNLRGNNIFGGGQKVSLMVDQREEDRSVVNASYGQPFFLIGMGEVQLDLQTRDYRNQFYEFGINVLYRFYLNDNLRLNTGLGWRNIEPSDSLERSYTDYSATVGVTLSEISDRKNIASYNVDWEIGYSSRQYSGSDDSTLTRSVYNDTKNRLSLSGQYPIYKGWSNYHRLLLYDLESSEKPITYSELFLIGGPNDLRGYRNGQFAVYRALIVNSETKFYFGRQDYLYPFVDYAYLWSQNSDGDDIKHDRVGYGLGFSLNTDQRAFKIELSWARGVAFDQPRVHARITALF